MTLVSDSCPLLSSKIALAGYNHLEVSVINAGWPVVWRQPVVRIVSFVTFLHPNLLILGFVSGSGAIRN